VGDIFRLNAQALSHGTIDQGPNAARSGAFRERRRPQGGLLQRQGLPPQPCRRLSAHVTSACPGGLGAHPRGEFRTRERPKAIDTFAPEAHSFTNAEDLSEQRGWAPRPLYGDVRARGGASRSTHAFASANEPTQRLAIRLRLRPSFFASYRASSARPSSEFSDSGARHIATPALTVMRIR
jgi:hypothetical protein